VKVDCLTAIVAGFHEFHEAVERHEPPNVGVITFRLRILLRVMFQGHRFTISHLRFWLLGFLLVDDKYVARLVTSLAGGGKGVQHGRLVMSSPTNIGLTKSA
jgi:hypothetical protein